MNKLKKIKIYRTLFLILITSLLFVFAFTIVSTIKVDSRSIKYADDYSIADLLKANEIALGYVIPTTEMVEKYDINEDGKITDTDTKIIQQMILGFYDSYEVRKNNRKVNKYI